MSLIEVKNIKKIYPGEQKPAIQDISFEVKEGEILTLLGPSGCGKTTILRSIAGFEKPDAGEISIQDRKMFSNDEWIPPEQRSVGMVFQDYALFPHLTVNENISFGLTKMKRHERQVRVKEMLEQVNLEGYGDRYPHQLSGGQQQRVALARALAPRPSVILLDEPFSNLDVALREIMRKEIRQIIKNAGITAIFVTHDQKDALTLSDRIAVIHRGKIEQIGGPREVYLRPKNSFVASFLGKTNIIRGSLKGNCVDTCLGEITCPLKFKGGTEDVFLSIRPELCRLARHGRGMFSGEVKDVIYSGDYQEILLEVKQGDETPEEMIIYAQVDDHIVLGETVHFDVVPEAITVMEK